MKLVLGLSSLICGCLSLLVGIASAQKPAQQKPTDVEIAAHVYEPVKLPVTDARIGQLKLPDRYILPGNAVFPEGIAYQPRTGDFFVSSTTDGTIFRGNLRDKLARVFLAERLET